MKKIIIMTSLSILLLFSFILTSCSVVKLSGTITRKTGEVMSEYSKENDGFIGKMAGLGGRINTSVGTAVEDVADNDDANKSKSKRFTEANKSVITAASSAVTSTDTKKSRIKSNHSSVNVRPVPSTDTPPIGSIKGGEEIVIIEEDGDWLKIQFTKDNYKEGWIYKYLAEGYNK